MGLNDIYQTTRGSNLMMQPLPSLSQAYRLVLQEERHRECNNPSKLSIDSATFASNFINSYKNTGDGYVHGQFQKNTPFKPSNNTQNQSGYSQSPSGYSQNQGGPVFGIAPNGMRSKFFCDFCKVFGHSIDRCFKVHGGPSGQKSDFKG